MVNMYISHIGHKNGGYSSSKFHRYLSPGSTRPWYEAVHLLTPSVDPTMNIAMENHHFLIGKPSINGPFSMAMLNNQMVD